MGGSWLKLLFKKESYVYVLYIYSHIQTMHSLRNVARDTKVQKYQYQLQRQRQR